jgi:hypothetical protein
MYVVAKARGRGRGKRKRPHIDQYEEGIAQGAIDESQHGKMVDPRFYAEN